MVQKELKVGDTLFIVPIDSRRVEKEIVIEKISRKYVTFQDEPRLRYNKEICRIEENWSGWTDQNWSVWDDEFSYRDYRNFQRKRKYVEDHLYQLSREEIEELYEKLQ